MGYVIVHFRAMETTHGTQLHTGRLIRQSEEDGLNQDRLRLAVTSDCSGGASDQLAGFPHFIN